METITKVYLNIYAAVYKTEKMEYEGITYSYAQIQVVEYLLENEERRDNMTAIAKRLGITRSNFTKIVKRLEEKGLVEKRYLSGNRKSMTVTVNKTGKSLYNAYSEKICAWHFSPMFEHLQKIPPQYRPYVRDALYAAMDGSDIEVKLYTNKDGVMTHTITKL